MKIQTRVLAASLVGILALMGANSSRACGEVMYRMGGALRYQAFVTRHPAQILLYSDDVRKLSDEDRVRFQRALAKAGHKITVVAGFDALVHALEARPYDVVITSAANLQTLDRAMSNVLHRPSLIPVTSREDDKSVRSHYPLAVHAEAGLNRFLKAIEQTMKSRSA